MQIDHNNTHKQILFRLDEKGLLFQHLTESLMVAVEEVVLFFVFVCMTVLYCLPVAKAGASKGAGQ